MLLVTKVFGFIISKDRGMFGWGLCMLFIWLGGVRLWLGVGYGVGAVSLVACRRLEGGVMWGLYVVCGMFVFICVCC